jgi:hypothetical protein
MDFKMTLDVVLVHSVWSKPWFLKWTLDMHDLSITSLQGEVHDNGLRGRWTFATRSGDKLNSLCCSAAVWGSRRMSLGLQGLRKTRSESHDNPTDSL